MSNSLQERRASLVSVGGTSTEESRSGRQRVADQVDGPEMRRILLADASDQATLLLARTAALTDELAIQAHAEAYKIEKTARDRAQRIVEDARAERERLLSSARQRASQIESEVSSTLDDLQYLDAVRSGQFAEHLGSQRAAHLAEFVEFLTRAAAELERLRSVATAELSRSGTNADDPDQSTRELRASGPAADHRALGLRPTSAAG
ncbi:hypothetical protein ATK74_2030 [Propionicimonas paludicola]|uniref:Uncharacterized protein n=1 Tax=Propionicimonas paludicola TaxID=185243 RepID=A0A2A9CV62_9ACTN|nr:hypothetical protein [Propionicimonas paludicola]PFG17459.1 hypothetical protein ATK74_2030 [Propionicimonas paludicola]